MIELICPGDLEHTPIVFISRTLGKTEPEMEPVSLALYSHMHAHAHKIHCSRSEVAQSCPTLCDPVDCSPPGSSVHGIFQARVLEWGAICIHMCVYSYTQKQENISFKEEGIFYHFL